MTAGGGACAQINKSSAVTHLCSITSDMVGLSLLDRDEASGPPAGGADCEPLVLPAVFPYQDPVPHPHSSPLPLHQQAAEEGGRGGSQPSEGDLALLHDRPFHLTPPLRLMLSLICLSRKLQLCLQSQR